MIIYSKERLVPTDVNMMVLSTKNADGYFYVHRALYDQAVIIYDLYGDDLSKLCCELTGSVAMRADVKEFIDNTPIPIKALGPFLNLVKEPLTEFVDMVGAIHVMSGPINFRKTLQIPKEMRNTASFSISIKEEYELSWDRFFQTAMPFNAEAVVYTNPMSGTATETAPIVQTSGFVDKDDAEELDDLEDLFAQLEATTNNFVASAQEGEKKVEKAPAPVEEPAPTVVEKAPEPAPAPKTGLDLLRSGGI